MFAIYRNAFARCQDYFALNRDIKKIKKYWESIDGQYENRIRIKKHRLGVNYNFQNRVEVTLIIKWTFSAKDSRGKWDGEWELDFVGIHESKEVLVVKDFLYALPVFGAEKDVTSTIEEQIRDGAKTFGVKDYDRSKKEIRVNDIHW